MSSEKLKVKIEHKNVEPVEFEANTVLCAGDTDDGVLFFIGGRMSLRIVLSMMDRFVGEFRSHERRPVARGVSLGENHIDHAQHCR